MTKKHSTKKALMASALSLLLCFTMLLGTTFAWFTDSVTSANNIIKSGTLDVEMYWAEGQDAVPTTDADWTDASQGAIFDYDKWEPGYAVVRHIKIANKGSLALKYKVRIAANGEVSNLSDVIDVYYLDPAVQVSDRAQLTDANKLGTLTDVLANLANTATGELLAGENDTITLALKMQETAGNGYQNKSIGTNFSVQLLATQLTSEKDSFDDQYDVESDYVAEVKTADALADALKAGGLVKLANDIIVSESLPITKDTVLDLNGKNVGTSGSTKGCPLYLKGGKLTIKNGTLDLDGSETNVHGTFATAIGYDAQTELVVENVTFTGQTAINGTFATNGPLTITVSNSTINTTNVGIAVAGESTEAIATINNCNINAGKYAIFASQGAKITINGGTYKSAENVITSMYAGSVVTVNGGSFEGNLLITANGALVIKGGTFNVDPSAYVAPGYQVTNNGDGTWTVDEYKVSTGAELVDAIANGKAVELTQDVTLGKIDLTGVINNDVVINANGHKITTTDTYGIEVTAGKNITISNANVEMTKEGDYITYAAGLKISNGDYAGATITLKNCTITMANTDWAYAVNMPASVKNLNLVIDNCTLEGAIAVQCWGDNNTIAITNSKLICNYTTSAQYTSYCVVLQDDGSYYAAENNTLVIDNCEFLYSGIDNFNSVIKAVADISGSNTVTVTNCTYGEKVVAD